MLPNGDLVAGGDFTTSGGNPVNYLARWNGASCLSSGGGTNGPVSSLFVRSNGELVVGGSFSTAGGLPHNRVAVWDGVAWRSLNSSLNGSVMALTEMQNGDIVAGGYFSQPGLHVARYTGTQWIPLGNGLATGGSDSVAPGLTVLPSGDLVAVGSIHGSGTSNT